MEVFHDHFNAAQNEHVRRGQAHKTIDYQTEEMEGTSRYFTHALRQFLQIAFGIRTEVDVRDQETADEEKCVDAEGTVCDRLEKKFLFDYFPEFHVVRVFEHDDACVAKNNPSHRNRTQTMNRWNGVAANAAITDCLEIVDDGERE